MHFIFLSVLGERQEQDLLICSNIYRVHILHIKYNKSPHSIRSWQLAKLNIKLGKLSSTLFFSEIKKYF